ncbi:hypothetical protein, partial [Burkholderia thailandensis]
MGNEGCISPIVNESSIMDSLRNRHSRHAFADSARAPASSIESGARAPGRPHAAPRGVSRRSRAAAPF